MRQVDRSKFEVPDSLNKDLSDAINKVRTNANNAQGAIYAHERVVSTLKIMYLEKCYLCECELKKNGEVEHFLPYSSHFPERAYDWNNLHWSCKACNARKRKIKYKLKASSAKGSPVIDTNLIDPTNPPKSKNISDLIGFSDNCRVCVIDAAEPKAVKTAEFLNEPDPFIERKDWWSEIQNTLMDCYRFRYREFWERVLIAQEFNPTEFDEIQTAMIAMEKADYLYVRFFNESSPFFSCIKRMLLQATMSVDDFKKLSTYYRSFKGEPPFPI